MNQVPTIFGPQATRERYAAASKAGEAKDKQAPRPSWEITTGRLGEELGATWAGEGLQILMVSLSVVVRAPRSCLADKNPGERFWIKARKVISPSRAQPRPSYSNYGHLNAIQAGPVVQCAKALWLVTFLKTKTHVQNL